MDKSQRLSKISVSSSKRINSIFSFIKWVLEILVHLKMSIFHLTQDNPIQWERLHSVLLSDASVSCRKLWGPLLSSASISILFSLSRQLGPGAQQFGVPLFGGQFANIVGCSTWERLISSGSTESFKWFLSFSIEGRATRARRLQSKGPLHVR